MLKKKRESKYHGARSEKELRLQLAEIEKAARIAVAEDRLSANQSSNLFGLNVLDSIRHLDSFSLKVILIGPWRTATTTIFK